METPQKKLDFVLPPVDEVLFRKQVQRELEDIREEVEEAYELDNEVEPVPESACDKTLSLLERMQRNIPMPDVMWLENEGIGLEWRPGNGIATMSVYGDGHVIYGAFFSDKREIAGVCALSDSALLPGFLTMLSLLFQ